MAKAPLKISPFARDKGERLTQAVRDQLHPLLNQHHLVAAKVVFLYDADGQMLAGSIDMHLQPGAAQFLEELIRQRYAGELGVAHKLNTVHQQHKKS